jgi:hypothetical protein
MLPDGVLDHGNAALVVNVNIEGMGGVHFDVFNKLGILLLAVDGIRQFEGVQL